MNREILFRALRKDGQGWVEGDLIQLDYEIHIAGKEMWAAEPKKGYIELQTVEVHPETVGQFTGITDKNKTNVFKHDKIKDCLTGNVYVVKFGFVQRFGFIGWYCEDEDGLVMPLGFDYDTFQNNAIEVIGNIHEGGNNG